MKKIIQFLITQSYKIYHVILLFFLEKFKVTHEYQPNPFYGSIDKAGRQSFDRYETLISNIEKDYPYNVLDLGCNKGFFILKMASFGGFCLGVDSDKLEIIAARSTSEIYNVKNASFVCSYIDAKFIDGLPKFDIIICTSIFHHWVRIMGKEEAFTLMNKMAEKTNSYLLFETGQYNEKSAKWYQELNFMRDNPIEWIKQFLLDLKFREVIVLGEYSTTVSDVKRTLFLAKK